MACSTCVRWKLPALGIAALLASAIETGGAWYINQPLDGSVRAKTSDVSGNGTADAIGNATFGFGYFDEQVELMITENDVPVTSSGEMYPYNWSGTIEPPTGGWRVSPTDEWGISQGDHFAWIEWTQRRNTGYHVVTEQ
jgi:hypothetical protein